MTDKDEEMDQTDNGLSDMEVDMERPVAMRTETAADTIRSVDAICEAARRKLRIFSPDMEGRLYNRRELSSILTRFIRMSTHSRLQILICDSSSVVRNGHELVRLAQRFPSYANVRLVHPDEGELSESWICADDSISLFRSHYLSWEGVFSDAGFDALRLNQRFDDMWERSTTDPNLQTFRL